MKAASLALAWLLAIAPAPGIAAGAAFAASPVSSSLTVWRAGAWRTWWRSDRAPARWTRADSLVTAAVHWQSLAKGLEWSSLRLGCGAPVWRARLIVARLDPHALELSLVMDLTREDARPAWTIDRAPGDALLAVNAGQFVGSMPWGWVVAGGIERLRPGHGPLASAIAIDAAGNVRWAHGDSIPTGGAVSGFQSYPTLLAAGGLVPAALRTGAGGISLTHRDARLALGETRDGHLLIVMTRFDMMGEAAAGLPLGPTTPEMAAIMGALGATDAVMLDGGISAQLTLRGAGRPALRWPGLRQVPLGLIARPHR